jgi:chemosensory pili system protein ChpA (sensor histidine kinase/response regulator)
MSGSKDNPRFPIDGVLRYLVKDMENFRSHLEACLAALCRDETLKDPCRELRETAHALKGTAAMGELIDLQAFGEKYEYLAEIAQSFINGAPEKAKEIFSFLAENLHLLPALMDRVVQGKSATGTEEYNKFDLEVGRRWGDYLQTYETGMYRSGEEDLKAPISSPGNAARGASSGGDDDDHLSFLEEGEEQVPFGSDDEEIDFLEKDRPPADDGEESLLEVFHEEVKALLPDLVQLLQEFQVSPRAELAQKLERIYHTLKGSAATVNLPEISEMAREMEDSLDPYLEGKEKIPPTMAAKLVEGTGKMLDRAGLGKLELSAASQAASEPPVPSEDLGIPPKAAPKSVRIEKPTPDLGVEAPEKELVEAFLLDAEENLEAIENALLKLEKDPGDRSLWETLFRSFHTLKGASNTMGQREIASMVHIIEDGLEGVLEGGKGWNASGLASLLFEVIDSIRLLLEKLQGKAIDESRLIRNLPERLAALEEGAAVELHAPEVKEAVPAEAAKEAPASSVAAEGNFLRVNTERLNALMNLVGELVVNRSRLDRKLALLDELKKQLNFCRNRLVGAVGNFQEKYEFSSVLAGAAVESESVGGTATIPGPTYSPSPFSESGFSELEFDRYDDFNILSRSLIETATDISEIIESIGNFFGSFSEESAQFRKITTTLQDEITRVRMVPLASLFGRLLRPIRDAAQKEGRSVRVVTEGEEAELDKTIIDRIYTPLLHIVRNAVAHGIETPGERQALGKDREGCIAIRARQESGLVLIEVEDDGQGINPEKVFAAARKCGFARADEPVSVERACELIFMRGVSSHEGAGEVSGRGVGLDVVRRETEKLNGTVSVQTQPGEGCLFVIRLPMTMTIHQALLVQVGKETLAIPLNLVQSSVIVQGKDIQHCEGDEVVKVRDQTLPLKRLAALLDLPSPTAAPGQADTSLTTILLMVNDRLQALVVDRILGKQEIVVKPLGHVIHGHRYLSGATLSGEGKIILILDVIGFLGRAPVFVQGRTPPTEKEIEKAAPVRKVLVVDDSISIRKVAAKYLQSAGIPTETAVDGLEALENLRKRSYAMVFTDLEMPRLNGYELIAEIRRQAATKDLPVVVITSRAGDKHRARANQAGATDYLTKPFSRDQLIEAVRHYAVDLIPADRSR